MGPILGAIADYRAIKKRMLAIFVGIGVITTMLMGTIGRGEWEYAALLFMIANIAIASSFVFYDSLAAAHCGARGNGPRVDGAAMRSAISAAAFCSSSTCCGF